MTRRAMSVIAVTAAVLCTSVLLVGPASAQSNTVYRWGGYRGSAGTDTFAQKVPTAVPNLANVTALAAGNVANYALESDGTEWAWGNGLEGELGNGTTTAFVTTPVQVQFPAGTVITAIAEANGYGFSADATGQVWAWGLTTRAGPHCLGPRITHVPHVVPGLSNIVALAGAAGNDLFLSASGSVYECKKGFNQPTLVTGLPGPAVAISDGNGFFSALLADGSVWNWGRGMYGQLGNGTFASSLVPQQVQLPAGTHAVQIYAGGDDSSNGSEIALLDTGQVVAWGSNQYDQLADGSTARSAVPVFVQEPAGVTYTYVVAGGGTCYAIDRSGNLWAWGNNNLGQVGANVTRHTVYPPMEVDSGVTLVSSTAANVTDYHS